MANKDKDKTSLPRKIKDMVSGVQANMDSLYTSTYYSSNKNAKDLDMLKNDISKSIDKITDNNLNNVGMPNISKLYSRIYNVQNDKDLINGMENMFNNEVLMDNILNEFNQNKYLKDHDTEIDTICKYMPKLLEALDARKDNVLSADHFSKDFINIVNDDQNDPSFNKRIRELKETYDLLTNFEDWYDRAAKYGEQFVYIVPYKKALEKIMANKGNSTSAQVQLENGTIISDGEEPFVSTESFDMIGNGFELQDQIHFNVEINNSNILDKAVYGMRKASSKLASVTEMAVNETVLTDILTETDDLQKIKAPKQFDHTIEDELEFDDFKDYTSQDGFFGPKQTEDKVKIDIPGCIIKKLDRTTVVPVYIESICLGYYHFELTKDDAIFNYTNKLADPLVAMKSSTKMTAKVDDSKRDNMLKYISAELSKFIDKKFINNNQDLRKEIYMILKYNDVFNTSAGERFRVTFIPPEDMIHIRFQEDENHRGISDLEKAMIPAKLYASLYITNTIAVMTRGQDKRAYYVKQTVDTNIAQTLLNVINQIKQGNFGIRQIENINYILNITGRFNDYVIPTNGSGEPPITMEVMP